MTRFQTNTFSQFTEDLSGKRKVFAIMTKVELSMRKIKLFACWRGFKVLIG
jgi:hypothetical protein